ncbi:hypothetical protein ACJX0J_035604 [Zea mays]
MESAISPQAMWTLGGSIINLPYLFRIFCANFFCTASEEELLIWHNNKKWSQWFWPAQSFAFYGAHVEDH